MALEHFLLATDGSNSAHNAEDYALKLSGGCGIKLTVLYVLDDHLCHYGKVDTLAPLEARESFISYVIEEQQEVADELNKKLNQAAINHKAEFTFIVRQGEPLKEISQLALELDIDQIIIGGKRPKKIRGFRMINLAEKLSAVTEKNIVNIL